MKKILLSCTCILTCSVSDITAVQRPSPVIGTDRPLSPIIRPVPTLPIVRPPVRPIRPINRPVIVREHYNYYTNVVSSCDEYIRIIEQKDQEIDSLKKEIESLKGKEFTKFQKNLKTEYEQELKKFDERKSGIKTKNSIDISNK